jgi:hypothetical protein
MPIVIPIGLCAHLMAPTYAIAEKASVMIKGNPTTARTPTNAGERAAMLLPTFSVLIVGIVSAMLVGL